MKLILFCFLVITSLHAQETYLQFCLSSSEQANQALRKIAFLKAQNDYVGQDGRCLDIKTEKRREDLYHKIMRQKYGIVASSNFIGTSSIPDRCNFLVKRIKQSNSNDSDINFKTSGINANNTRGNSRSVTNQSLVVDVGREASLSVNNNTLKLKCSKTGNGYSVDISLGTTDSSLTTSRYLSKGMTIDLGGVVESIKGNNKTIGINEGFNSNNESQNSVEKVYLSIQ